MQRYSDDELIEALERNSGNKAATARELHYDERALRRRLKRLALKGYSPDHDMTRVVPDGFKVKGVSSYYNRDGVLSGQWVKSTEDRERQYQMMLEAVAELRKDIPHQQPIKAPTTSLPDLLNVFNITDYHLGMKSWGEETGADWDTKIAADLLVKWFGSAIAQAPDAEHCVFAQIGDFLHWDGLASVTPTSGHIVDADTRYQHIIRVAIQVVRRCINMLLAKHKTVYVLMAEGNHDLAGSAWLRELFAELYADEPRVTVDTSADPYYCHEFGNCSLFWHHGHKKKLEALDDVFVSKFREVFGRTKHSYGYTGHLHHDKMLETNLMIMEQLRTLAAPDSHASRGGWMSGRDAKVDTYHRQYGRIGRVIVTPEMALAGVV